MYHEYSRNLHEGDLRNHISGLRWTVKYHNRLLTSEKVHVETFWEYQGGKFIINRTTKPFLENPIDLPLEQTINIDAAIQKTGIAAITNSTSACQRWTESHSLRTIIHA